MTTFRPLTAVLALVALIGITSALWVARDADDDTGSATTTTAVVTTTTAPPTTTTTLADTDRSAIWPFPGDAAFDDPVSAATSFAVEFLGFTDPVVGDFQQGDTRSGEVPVQPAVPGPVTTIFVRQLSGESTWSVLGAATEGIDLRSPMALSTISSPVAVSGEAIAFEGNVIVEVREDGRVEPLGSGNVTGGGDVKRPFEGSIAFDSPTTAFGSIVLYTRSAKDGAVWEAGAIRVALRSGEGGTALCTPTPAAKPATGEMAVTVFYSCGDDPAAVVAAQRIVPQSTGVLRASLEALLAGPTQAERDAKVQSWFSGETASMLRSVNVRDGRAVVDFGDLRSVIPNASASAGSALLLAQLDATVFQFDTVDSVEYRLEGSCDEFGQWLQLEPCEQRARS